MKIALIGADGQLGTDLKRLIPAEDLVPLYYPEFDITKPHEARTVLLRSAPRVIINTAAYHQVDDCEDHPQQAFLVNAVAVRDLAYIAGDLDAVLVHFSTDYVFDGMKRSPYSEADEPNPLSVYALSKLAGEIFVRNIWRKHFIVRTCGLYGEAGCAGKGTNFVESMMTRAQKGEEIRVVSDQRVTPTATAELAPRVLELVRTEGFGLYHLTNEGDCSWHEFAEAVFSLTGTPARLHAVTSGEWRAKARRPLYSVLENKKAKGLGLTGFSHWRAALGTYLTAKGYLRR